MPDITPDITPVVPSIPSVPPVDTPAPQGSRQPTPTPTAPVTGIPGAPGMHPGFVPNMGQPVNGQGAPAQQASPAALTPEQIQEMIRAATTPKPTQPASTERPAWVPEDVQSLDLDTIQDPIIRSMATVLKAAGGSLDLNRVIGRALAYCDPNLVDTAYIAEKGGASAQQIDSLAKGIVQAVAAKSEQITAAVFADAGGEAAWNANAQVFNSTAPQELRLTVKTMLNSTDERLIRAGAKMVSDFARSSGKLPQAPQGNFGNLAAGGAAAAAALGKEAFKIELWKLDRNPDQPGYREAREALLQRRALGRRLGMN